MTFNCFADFSAYKRVIFDTSEGNIYVKFLYGAEFGKAQTDTSSPTSSEVVLTGGNMVFWYLYQEGNYDVDHPTLAVNPYTNVGIVTASSGAGRGNDGLYIVSNDDALITFGQNAVLNGYLYAPHGHIFFAPSAEHATFTVLNGCMAIESLVMLTTADQSSQSWWDEFWNNLWGGWDSTDIIDSVIEQYGDLVFNYVQPPLISPAAAHHGFRADGRSDGSGSDRLQLGGVGVLGVLLMMRSARMRRGARKGFTLVEAIVSIAVFAVAAVMFAMILFTSTNMVNLSLVYDRDRVALMEFIETGKLSNIEGEPGYDAEIKVTTIDADGENSRDYQVFTLSFSELKITDKDGGEVSVGGNHAVDGYYVAFTRGDRQYCIFVPKEPIAEGEGAGGGA